MITLIDNLEKDIDEILYNQQAAKVLELLFKSTASGELGEYKTAKKFTKAAYNIIGNILWSPDSMSSRSRDSQTSEDTSLNGDIQEETSSLDKLRKKIMVRDENVRENIGLSKEISRLISSDDENSDTEQNIDSQNLFQNTEIRKNASRTFFNRTPERKSPATSRVQSPAASPVKSLLRTPTEKFKKKPTQGLKWPNPYPMKDFDESPRRRVSFNSIPKVKLYDPYQTDSQSTLSDIEVISGKFHVSVSTN